MTSDITAGILIPFAGTALGSGMVFFMRRALNDLLRRALIGFASGVMVAASVWSLILPAMDAAEAAGDLPVLPAVIGFWMGVLFLLVLDVTIPHLHAGSTEPEGRESTLGRTAMLVLAVTIHNIPEGMAVGVVLAGWMADCSCMTLAGALALSLGIAIQNFPEGAIISMPLHAEGISRSKAFLWGALSGAVEPVAAVITMLAVSAVLAALPYLLSFAAGAMVYVVVEELIPEMSEGRHSNIGTLAFSVGFTLMLVLDTMLG